MKKVLITLLAFGSVSTFAQDSYLHIECVDTNNQKMVSAILDIETGDESHFSHYVFGEESSSTISHFESEPTGTEDGYIFELYTSLYDGSPAAKLGLKDLRIEDNRQVGTGELFVAVDQTVVEIKKLECLINLE